MSQLLLLHKDETLRRITLPPGGITIGRGSANQIQLDSPAVAERHARIFTVGAASVVQDLNSESGTFVNDEAVTRYQLQHYDIIHIGSYRLRFHTDTRAPVDTAAPVPEPILERIVETDVEPVELTPDTASPHEQDTDNESDWLNEVGAAKPDDRPPRIRPNEPDDDLPEPEPAAIAPDRQSVELPAPPGFEMVDEAVDPAAPITQDSFDGSDHGAAANVMQSSLDADSPAAAVDLLSGPNKGLRVWLRRRRTVLGNKQDRAVVILARGSEYRIVAANTGIAATLNGTLLLENAEPLGHGDRIEFANLALQFHVDGVVSPEAVEEKFEEQLDAKLDEKVEAKLGVNLKPRTEPQPGPGPELVEKVDFDFELTTD